MPWTLFIKGQRSAVKVNIGLSAPYMKKDTRKEFVKNTKYLEFLNYKLAKFMGDSFPCFSNRSQSHKESSWERPS